MPTKSKEHPPLTIEEMRAIVDAAIEEVEARANGPETLERAEEIPEKS